MRNFWIFVSKLGMIVAVGGSIYYFSPHRQIGVGPTTSPTAQELAAPIDHVVVTPGANPLLTANAAQFDRWFPSYPMPCGAILFEDPKRKQGKVDFCVQEIVKRVGMTTGIQIARADVLDPSVQAHWRDVMGRK